MIIRETADQYHAREAVSASLLWSIVKPDGCLAKARHESSWLNPDLVEPPAEKNLEFGEVAHLAALERSLLDDRVALYLGDNWRTKESQEFADEARAAGKVPLLKHRTRTTAKTVYTFDEVLGVRKALEANKEVADLLFGEGESEVTYTWDHQDWHWAGPAYEPKHTTPLSTISCKARADRLVRGAIVDLKTAECASWRAFQYAMRRDGHHMRAAWYLDGWFAQPPMGSVVGVKNPDYIFVVVEKKEPYLSAIWKVAPRALEWGRRWNNLAMKLLIKARETGEWPSYQAPDYSDAREVSLSGDLEWDYSYMEKAGFL